MNTVEIETTDVYDKWFATVRDQRTVSRIRMRLARVEEGNFGDHKNVGDGVCELRFKHGAGVRIYYTYDGRKAVLLLAGGDKSTQKQDIATAKAIWSSIRSTR